MPWSAVNRFSDPFSAQMAVQGVADIEVLPTTKGNFDTEITKIRFDRLWMQRFRSTLPQVVTVSHKLDRKVISFITEPKSAKLQSAGVEVLPGDIVVNGHDVLHQRFDGAVRHGAMSLPNGELKTAFEIITGRELREQQSYIVHPNAELMSRLLKLHDAIGLLAHETPDILELPEVGRALEQKLIHLMVRCLAADAVEKNNGARRHEVVMRRFVEFLQLHPDQPLYLTEICASIEVSERTLRACCEEHLGMGPIRYLTLRRMHLARRALFRADPSTSTVTRIATDHGFWELGRFSVAYRTLFGESPSETLRLRAE
jgi:AraC-like DNA-binding protein